MEEKMVEITNPRTGGKVKFPKKDIKIIPPVEVSHEQTIAQARQRGEDVIPITPANHQQDVRIRPNRPEF